MKKNQKNKKKGKNKKTKSRKREDLKTKPQLKKTTKKKGVANVSENCSEEKMIFGCNSNI